MKFFTSHEFQLSEKVHDRCLAPIMNENKQKGEKKRRKNENEDKGRTMKEIKIFQSPVNYVGTRSIIKA